MIIFPVGGGHFGVDVQMQEAFDPDRARSSDGRSFKRDILGLWHERLTRQSDSGYGGGWDCEERLMGHQ